VQRGLRDALADASVAADLPCVAECPTHASRIARRTEDELERVDAVALQMNLSPLNSNKKLDILRNN